MSSLSHAGFFCIVSPPGRPVATFLFQWGSLRVRLGSSDFWIRLLSPVRSGHKVTKSVPPISIAELVCLGKEPRSRGADRCRAQQNSTCSHSKSSLYFFSCRASPSSRLRREILTPMFRRLSDPPLPCLARTFPGVAVSKC